MTQQTQTKQLPKGWKEGTLQDLAQETKNAIVDGPFGTQMKVHEFQTEGIPVIEMQNLKYNAFNSEFRRFISAKKFEEIKRSEVKSGDIIISKTGTLGLVAIAPENLKKAIITSRLAKITLDKTKANSHYVYYNLIFLRQIRYWEKVGKGTTMKILTIKNLQDAPINYPESKQEQQLIVSEIETQFSRLEEAVKVLKSVKDKLNIYRKAVLKKAFEKEEIKKEKIGDICVINPSKAEVKNLDENFEVSFIPMAYVSEDGKIISMDKRPLKEVNKGFTFFKNGDVLLAKITPCFENGKKAIAEGLTNGIGFGTTEFYVLRPQKKVISKWLFYNVSREDFRALAKRSMGGAVGQQRVSKNMIENFEVPVPSIEEQKKIIQEIESKFSVIDKVEEVVSQSLINAEKLRKSILKSAFEGKLVKFEEVKVK